MFQYTEKVLAKNTFQFRIKQEDKLLTFGNVIQLWKTSALFRTFYTQLLREVPFLAFFWENSPFTNNSLDQPYEFVVVGTDAFNGKKPNALSFNQYFSIEQPVISFPNLGKNAQLVVPCPLSNSYEVYTHLGSFIRNAPVQQIDRFWQVMGHEVEKHLNECPLWLSTSGLGVYWLHVRLDQRPKYYSHSPYKSF
ncbi:DUF6940 family protein [Aureispira anguillae]|uniref:Uncharacterized protein n=1 Tax=Aureispira anguillae TaxID=2864201 RepID=A0A915YE16_9BACT|nr:hypothetical protein [Aureispira anguillae]BDS11402.1 hypothetical protein AsAng_0021160 [Aureispira anguillae]